MNRKNERVFLFFLTVFLLVMLISNIVNYITGAGSFSLLTTLCFAGGLICTIVAWVQHIRGEKKDEE